MRSTYANFVVGFVLACGLPMAAFAAEEAVSKPLPVLLIKGEVVSVDATDPSASLLKVKDRYGFETPIYVTSQTKIAQGEQTVPLSSLSAGSSVDVEYNFDVNTAKRHAVSVQLAASAPSVVKAKASAVPAAVAAQPAVAMPMPVAPAATTPAAAVPASAASAAAPAASSAAPVEPATAPAASQQQPASSTAQ